MAVHQHKWPPVLGWINIGLGVALFLGYWVYLPLQERFVLAGTRDPGMILYALATAGGAFVAWGMVLRGASAELVPRALVFKASAAGFALLGLMRVGTALFPHGHFVQMVALPAVECAVFLLLAWVFFKSAGGKTS